MRTVFKGVVCSAAFVGGTASHLRATTDVAALEPKLLSELHSAEGMVAKMLQGQPDLAKKEMQLLHGAETAAADVEKSHGKRDAQKKAQLLQQKGKTAASTGMAKAMGELLTVESMAEKVFKGHPKELEAERQALHQAEAAARDLKGMNKHNASHNVSAFVEAKQQSHTVSVQEVENSVAALEEQRNGLMATSLQKERSYGAAEHDLANDGKKVLSEFSTIEGAIADAFAGKDSRAVKTAMQAGALLEEARKKQQQATDSNAAEASNADKRVALLAAQTAAQTKVQQEQRAYTSGMAQLAKDDQAALSQFATIKGAVAQAFAGQDSKAVEKAMDVAELLDTARTDQQEVATGDAKEAADAPRLFRQFSATSHFHAAALPPRVSAASPAAALAQSQSQSQATMKAEQAQAQRASSMKAEKVQQARRLTSLAVREQHILGETDKVEDLLKHNLGAKGAEATMKQEVLAVLENATQVEQRAYSATSRASAAAARAADHA